MVRQNEAVQQDAAFHSFSGERRPESGARGVH
jgi:hypothetical protein